VLSEVIAEDYGAGFWARRGQSSYWVAVTYVGVEAQEHGREHDGLAITATFEPGLNPWHRMARRATPEAGAMLQAALEQAAGKLGKVQTQAGTPQG
jgi:hypothetical protein